ISGPAATLSIEDLTVQLPIGADREHAVQNVSFQIRPGELLCLVGESGSGKSIIAQTVMGLLPRQVRPVGGRVHLDGEDLLAASPRRLRQLRGVRMGMIFQEPMTALNPLMTCGAQVKEMLARHTNLSAKERRERVLQMLERVRLSDAKTLQSAYPHQLSGGQRQRVMIAMALALAPALLIADEPTTALDVTTQAEILKLLRDLQRESQTAVLFITHDLGVVAEIADRIAVLERGELIEAGPAHELLARPQHAYTRMLLDSVPSLTPRKSPIDVRAAIQVRTCKLTKVFDEPGWLRRRRRIAAAVDVELELRRGETLGIVGESGSGKSTVARMIAHLLEASAGSVEVDGAEVTHLKGQGARGFRRKVQIVFQDPYRSLNPRRTVGWAIAEGPRNFGASRESAWKRACELMELVKLPSAALHRFPDEFSGGQRQRICIARALAVGPEVLIADEAVSALDVSVQAQILGLLEEIQQRLRLTMLFITHDLRVAAQICNRIAVMYRGRIVEEGSASTIFREPKHQYTRSLLAAVPGREIRFKAEA